MRMEPCILACVHTYIRTHVHTYIHTCIQIHIHTNIHAYTYTYIHAYIHACTHTYPHTQTHTHTHRFAHSFRTYSHAYSHTSTHYIHIICIYSVRALLGETRNTLETPATEYFHIAAGCWLKFEGNTQKTRSTHQHSSRHYCVGLDKFSVNLRYMCICLRQFPRTSCGIYTYINMYIYAYYTIHSP